MRSRDYQKNRPFKGYYGPEIVQIHGIIGPVGVKIAIDMEFSVSIISSETLVQCNSEILLTWKSYIGPQPVDANGNPLYVTETFCIN
jgi:hypothetical protein